MAWKYVCRNNECGHEIRSEVPPDMARIFAQAVGFTTAICPRCASSVDWEHSARNVQGSRSKMMTEEVVR